MSTSLKLAGLLAASSMLAACAKPSQQADAAAAAGAPAPVKWDTASNDPAKNLVAANKETAVPGFNP